MIWISDVPLWGMPLAASLIRLAGGVFIWRDSLRRIG
jgi:hypothetical protein